MILRECIRYEPLAKIVLNSEEFFNLFTYVELSTFDVASDAFSTFKVTCKSNSWKAFGVFWLYVSFKPKTGLLRLTFCCYGRFFHWLLFFFFFYHFSYSHFCWSHEGSSFQQVAFWPGKKDHYLSCKIRNKIQSCLIELYHTSF